jgi:hypothetical protein
VARQQQVARAADGTIVVNNENLVHRDAAAASQAVREPEIAADNCPRAYLPPVVKGQRPTKFTISFGSYADAGRRRRADALSTGARDCIAGARCPSRMRLAVGVSCSRSSRRRQGARRS